GEADWDEARYWIGEIHQFCRTHDIVCVLVPAPLEFQIQGTRREDHYPGRLTLATHTCGLNYYNLIDLFVNEQLRLQLASDGRPSSSPLFNGHIADGHFSALGAATWARALTTRLTMLLTPRMDRLRNHEPNFKWRWQPRGQTVALRGGEAQRSR